MNVLERQASAYGSDCDRVRQDLGIAESQLRDYQARLGKSFLHERYQSELTELRDRLKANLASTGHEFGEAHGPSAAELAGWIRAIKAANTVEGMPQRVHRNQATAEEPATASIHCRTETSAASDPAIEPDSAADAAASADSLTASHGPAGYASRVSM